MKILFVTPYYKPSVGGVQRYVEDLATAYRGAHEIVIVTTRLARSEPAREVQDGITIYRLPVLLKVANTPFHPFWRAQLKAIYAREKPDIINAHAPVPWLADIAQRSAGAKTPFVLTYHSGSMKKGSFVVDAIIGFYERFVLPKTFASVSRLIAVYPDFVRRIVGNSRHIAHITPGIDTTFFTPGKHEKKYDLMFAARLEKTSEWKGANIALEVVAELAHRGKKISFLLAGDGDNRETYERMAEQLEIQDQVTFVGNLSREQLRDSYRSSKVVVLPSLTESESFGMVVAEAASCETPAIGSRIGGIPHVIEDGVTGQLVPVGDVGAFADTLSSLLEDEARRRRYGQAARARVERLFSREHLIDATATVFEYAVSSPYPKNIQVVAYYPPALGGMERVAENVAIELAESGQSVEVVTSSIGYKPDFKDAEMEGYTVTRLGGRMVAGLPVIPALLWRLVRQPRQSLYHVHVAQAFLPEIALLAARLRQGIFVAHFHLDAVPSGRFGVIFAAYKRTLFPFMLRHADRVIVFSDDQKELVQNKYGVSSERVYILPNGIRRGFERKTERILHDQPRVLFVGRLSAQKNIRFLLDALEGISNSFSTRIVGEGELRAELEQYAKKLKLKNVIFAGRKDDDALYKEYDDADIFVLPSEREGMPLVLIDAMAMRLPAVGSDVLGIRDVIHDGKNGYLVPLDDAAALRAALQKIVSSETIYRHMSQEASDTVRELAWPRLVRRLVSEVYP